jgi:hypothetical protein
MMATQKMNCFIFVRGRIRVGKLYRGMHDEKFRDRSLVGAHEYKTLTCTQVGVLYS